MNVFIDKIPTFEPHEHASTAIPNAAKKPTVKPQGKWQRRYYT